MAAERAPEAGGGKFVRLQRDQCACDRGRSAGDGGGGAEGGGTPAASAGAVGAQRDGAAAAGGAVWGGSGEHGCGAGRHLLHGGSGTIALPAAAGGDGQYAGTDAGAAAGGTAG